MIAREKDFAEYIDAQFKFLKRSLLELLNTRTDPPS